MSTVSIIVRIQLSASSTVRGSGSSSGATRQEEGQRYGIATDVTDPCVVGYPSSQPLAHLDGHLKTHTWQPSWKRASLEILICAPL